MNAEDLDKKIEQISTKNTWYEENGKSKLLEQIQEMQDKVKQEEEREKQLEKEATKHAQEEESKDERPSRGRGGRGRGDRGRGRGNYGGDRDDRPSTRGRGTRLPAATEAYRPRSEFEDDEDDSMYSAPVRPQVKKQKQKLTDLEVNEDNYPTL
jgi:hypothetical protein